MPTESEVKAKRRIKRFVKTGKHQARVHPVDDKTYEYKEKHGLTSIFFRRNKIGRLRKVDMK